MKLIGIIGMPGSGKSELFNSAEFDGFAKFDDVLAKRELNEQQIQSLIQQGKSVLVSDIEFCEAEARKAFEKRVGMKAEWIYFENAPWKCAKNSLYRYITRRDRNVLEELIKIDRLSQTYQPLGDIREVKQMSLKPFWR